MIGRSHQNLQTFVGNFAGCLEKQGRNREEIRNTLKAMMRPFGISLAEKAPEEVRSLALEHFISGEYSKAEELLKLLLDAGFESVGTHPHRGSQCSREVTRIREVPRLAKSRAAGLRVINACTAGSHRPAVRFRNLCGCARAEA